MINVVWDEIEESDRADFSFDRPTPGAYIAVIKKVEDREDRSYLCIQWDYADGEYVGYNTDTYQRAGFWPTLLIKSYKQKALPYFKRFKNNVEASNPGYQFSCLAPERLVGKKVGLVLGEEEYKGKDGTIKVRLYIYQTYSTQDIIAGNFTIPEGVKPLKDKTIGNQLFTPAPQAKPSVSAAYPPPTDADAYADMDDDVSELPF